MASYKMAFKPTRPSIIDVYNMAASQLRSFSILARRLRVSRRAFTTTSRQFEAVVPASSRTETSPALAEDAQTKPIEQAPNRTDVWSRSQAPRSKAMTGPRFEQTDFDLQVTMCPRNYLRRTTLTAAQPQPLSAMEMIHKEPVRWTHDRTVACDGGGGPAGHPRIFINTDKPEIATCNYCGIPYVCFTSFESGFVPGIE
ncbi:hypothetical protein E4U42_001649 [Claviceps africana]|uniref:Zinc finger CHCC-type domain-containing protein n=1 Tax=Claviceps africana TaxID=83212 RepID=A0A8K0NL59_9HYPO|nr:hypothetical protein E4U42_001649 [Claviceps africana]